MKHKAGDKAEQLLLRAELKKEEAKLKSVEFVEGLERRTVEFGEQVADRIITELQKKAPSQQETPAEAPVEVVTADPPKKKRPARPVRKAKP